jgi:hypothetical protein
MPGSALDADLKFDPTPIHNYAWRHHCRGLFQMPIAA